MSIVLAGASGLLGTALRRELTDRGQDVHLLVRREPVGPHEHHWDPARGELDPEALAGARAVVDLAGSPVGVRWTRRNRREILASRIAATSTLARALAVDPAGPRVLVQASAVGWYGERGDQVLTEASGRGEGFLADVVAAWEAAASPASRAGVRVALARTGIVLAADGGAMARMLPLVRLGLGGPLGTGRQWWSWIGLRDEIRALAHLVDVDVEGPVNLTSPHPAPQIEVVRALAARARRPALLPVPALALRAVVGGFAGEILASQRVAPEALLASGFTFGTPDLASVAREVLPG